MHSNQTSGYPTTTAILTQFVQWLHCTTRHTERVLKQAALNCAERYFDDKEKQGMPMLAATTAEFSISSQLQVKKTNPMISEMLSLRACVARLMCKCLLRRAWYVRVMWHCRCNNILARGPACGVCPPDPLLKLLHPELSAVLIYCSL